MEIVTKNIYLIKVNLWWHRVLIIYCNAEIVIINIKLHNKKKIDSSLLNLTFTLNCVFFKKQKLFKKKKKNQNCEPINKSQWHHYKMISTIIKFDWWSVVSLWFESVELAKAKQHLQVKCNTAVVFCKYNTLQERMKQENSRSPKIRVLVSFLLKKKMK